MYAIGAVRRGRVPREPRKRISKRTMPAQAKEESEYPARQMNGLNGV